LNLNLNTMKDKYWSRRKFISSAGLGALALGTFQYSCSTSKKALQAQVAPPAIQGFERDNQIVTNQALWKPFSDRKLRVGIAGYGVCRFGADFGFQNHPNVEIVAVTDLFPDRCDALAKVCGCSKKYPSIEEMVKDEKVEAVFVATDAPSHAQHVIEALEHGKHVASAVPAVFGSLEDAEMLFEAVKKSGLKYMMFETSCFREDLYGMRRVYEAGGLGKLVYAEGE
ncbi:MAG: Gfo/Idh/MocA family oxidoreductase, partial [Bacteroidota bacterium]